MGGGALIISHRTQRLVILAALLLVLMVSCSHFAYVLGDGPNRVPEAPDADLTGHGDAEAGVGFGPADATPSVSEPGPSNVGVDVGPVELLFPGFVKDVPLTIHNPFGFGIDVQSIRVTSAGTSSCPAEFLQLRTYDVSGPAIDAHSQAPATTRIGLADNAPDSCQGERFSVRVTVMASRS